MTGAFNGQCVGGRVIRFLLAAVFVGSAWMKLAASEFEVSNFERFGNPSWFMYAVGIVQLLGAVSLWVRGYVAYETLSLSALMAGGVASHLRAGDPVVMSAPALGLLAPLCGFAFVRRGEPPSLRGVWRNGICISSMPLQNFLPDTLRPISTRQGCGGDTEGILIDLAELPGNSLLSLLPKGIRLGQERAALVAKDDPPDTTIPRIALDGHETPTFQGLQVGRDGRSIRRQMLRQCADGRRFLAHQHHQQRELPIREPGRSEGCVVLAPDGPSGLLRREAVAASFDGCSDRWCENGIYRHRLYVGGFMPTI